MPRKAKAKPRTPAQIAAERLIRRAQDFDAVGLAPDAAGLNSNDDVAIVRMGEATAEGQRAAIDVARRLDAFEALRPSLQRSCPGAYDAARRLERTLLVSLGQHDHGRKPDRVDCEQAGLCRVDIIVSASQECLALRAQLPERDGWLLWELIAPTRPWTDWRQIAAYVTGESHAHAQAAAVRAACVNLRDAYGRRQRKAA